MQNKPGVQIYLKGDRVLAQSFVKDAFRVYEQYLRNRENAANVPAIDKLRPRIPGADVTIMIHHDMAEIHITAVKEGVEEERKQGHALDLKRPREKERVLTRVYVHVDVMQWNTAGALDKTFLFSERSSIRSAVAAATWDSAVNQFVDIKVADCPYILFLNDFFSSGKAANTAAWPGIFPDVTGFNPATYEAIVDHPHYDAAIGYYESLVPSKYGPGVVLSQESTYPFASLEETWVEYPAGTKKYPHFRPNSYYIRPYIVDATWFLPPSGSNALPHTVLNGCEGTQAWARHYVLGVYDEREFLDATRRYYNFGPGEVSQKCGFSYSYQQKDLTPNPDQYIEIMAHSSPVFGPVFNLTTRIEGFGNDDVLVCSPASFPWFSFYYWGYGSAVEPALLDYMPPTTKLIYPGAYVSESDGVAEYHQAMMRPFGGMGINPTSATFPNGDSYVGEVFLSNVRTPYGGGFRLDSLVHFNMAIGRGIDLWTVRDTAQHVAPTAGVVELYKLALQQANGYLLDPTTISDQILDQQSPIAIFGGTGFDIRELSSAVAGSPILDMKIYVAPIRIKEPLPDEIIYEGLEIDG